MQEQKTITINGRIYDARTGMVIETSSDSQPTTASLTPAVVRSIAHQRIHAPTQQRSQTLRRRTTAKPSIQQAAETTPAPTTTVSTVRPIINRAPARMRTATVRRPSMSGITSSQTLQRKKMSVIQPVQANQQTNTPAQHTPMQSSTAAPARPPLSTSDLAPQVHPAAHKAHQAQLQKAAAATAQRAPKPAATIKDEAIESALSQAVRNHKDHKKPKKRTSGFVSIGASTLALLLLGGYFTYINMPNLSVRVAAAQAGFEASYPDYRPDGYRLNGPIAAENGKVSMKFASNSGPQQFGIKQEKSNWDSMAVREYVAKTSDNNAITTTVDGLTIYIYGSNAAWVNGGVLYTVDGDAPLSGEQIRRIATSM